MRCCLKTSPRPHADLTGILTDLQESTYWSTNRGVQFPHYLIIDLGQDQTFTGLYLPRVEAGAPESIRQYRIYVKSSEFKM